MHDQRSIVFNLYIVCVLLILTQCTESRIWCMSVRPASNVQSNVQLNMLEVSQYCACSITCACVCVAMS